MRQRDVVRRCALAAALAAAAGLLPTACAPRGVRRMHVDQASLAEDTGVSSQDLRTVTQRMARSLITIHAIAQAPHPPRVAFLEMANRSNEILDTNMFLEKIRSQLIKYSGGRLRFLDRASVKVIIKEREAKRAGLITSGKRAGLAGADFFLTGVISSIDKARGAHRATYTRFSFRLTDAETSDIVWEDEYEMKKAATRDFWDR